MIQWHGTFKQAAASTCSETGRITYLHLKSALSLFTGITITPCPDVLSSALNQKQFLNGSPAVFLFFLFMAREARLKTREQQAGEQRELLESFLTETIWQAGIKKKMKWMRLERDGNGKVGPLL